MGKGLPPSKLNVKFYKLSSYFTFLQTKRNVRGYFIQVTFTWVSETVGWWGGG